MRSIWKGAVSFGLVSISVRLYSATEEKDIRFHQVHRADGGRIRYKRTCSVCGEEVSYDDIAKGYDLGGGEMVVLTDDDFADLPLATSHAIDVLEFVPAEQVDPILYAKAYYLEPDGSATKPYVLLRDALTRTDRVAIVKVALRQREQLATLRVRDDVLVLNTMLWPDEVRKPAFDFLDDDIDVRPAELAMAGSLIESMAADFEPTAYTDDYRAALQEVIDAKVGGREVVAPEAEEPAPAGAIDLMAALRASVERARAARGEAAGDHADATPIRSAESTATGQGRTATSGGSDRSHTAAPAKNTSGKAAAKKAAPARKAAPAKATATKKTAAAKTAEPAKKTAAKKTAARKSA
ncbi:Ku protein [Planosporangium sp. 12N6]|uniref:non-homologous end joining protein Ku n=1 Tax=Planosporangium spinosum TaxID=3402278 RepID=UPI003CF54E47